MRGGARPGIGEDPVLGYILATRGLHQDLCQVLTQAAGYALLVLTRGRRRDLLDGPIATAASALRAKEDELAATRVPEAASHHHLHLRSAAIALRRALESLETCLMAGSSDTAQDGLTRALRAATDHLRAATRALPGFEMVDLTQACCAAHGRTTNLSCDDGTFRG